MNGGSAHWLTDLGDLPEATWEVLAPLLDVSLAENGWQILNLVCAIHQAKRCQAHIEATVGQVQTDRLFYIYASWKRHGLLKRIEKIVELMDAGADAQTALAKSLPKQDRRRRKIVIDKPHKRP